MTDFTSTTDRKRGAVGRRTRRDWRNECGLAPLLMVFWVLMAMFGIGALWQTGRIFQIVFANNQVLSALSLLPYVGMLLLCWMIFGPVIKYFFSRDKQRRWEE